MVEFVVVCCEVLETNEMVRKVAEDVAMTEASTEPYQVPILETVKASQQQNGLRHRDYQRYRQYCTRRLRRIRKSVKFMHGKGKAFVNKKVDAENASEARHLHLLLYNAERAWSYAMQLKEEDNLEKKQHGDEANSRIKFHLAARLRKAADWSQRLATVCATRADARTSLEAEAYAAYMAGNLFFHQEKHDKALERFKTARRIYADLSQVGTLVQKELFRSLVQELDPFLRFCEHRLHLLQPSEWSAEMESNHANDDANANASGNLLLQSKLEMVLLEARKQKAAQMKTIVWKHRELALPTQEICIALVRVEELVLKMEQEQSSLSEKKRELLYLEVLSGYDSLLQLIRDENLKYEQQAKSGSSLVNAQMESLALLEEYVRVQKLRQQIDRTIALLQQQWARNDVQPSDLLHLLDMVIQNVDQITGVPDISEEDTLCHRYAAYLTLFKSIRATQVAQVYLNNKKFPEALSLYRFATALFDETEETLMTKPAAKDEHLQKLSTQLKQNLDGASARTTALSFLQKSQQTESLRQDFAGLKVSSGTDQKKQKTLLERQQVYDAGTSKGLHELVSLPPEFVPIPCKPLLFDMAFNELEMPDISERMKTEEEKKAEQAKTASGGGIFGWFRS